MDTNELDIYFLYRIHSTNYAHGSYLVSVVLFGTG